jgi:hypothetical protein
MTENVETEVTLPVEMADTETQLLDNLLKSIYTEIHLYHRHRYIVRIVHISCFPVSDVEISSSTSVHPLFTLILVHTLSSIHILVFT